MADSKSLSRLIDIALNYHEEHGEAEQSLNYTTSGMVDATMRISELGVSEEGALHNVLFKVG
jgi:hypothetical protein